MRHLRRAALPLALLLAVQAACADEPTALPGGGGPSLALGATAEPVVAPIVIATDVLLQVRASNGLLVPTTTVEFTATDSPGHTVRKLVTDNGAGDTDFRAGYYRVRMPFTNAVNAYAAQLQSAPVQYALFGAFARGSYGVPNTDIGTMPVVRKPVITLRMRGGFGFLVGGATINYSSSGSGVMDTFVTDNAWGDLDATIGEISFRVLNNAAWTVCETTPPTNMRPASPSCISVQAPFDGTAAYDVWHAAM